MKYTKDILEMEPQTRAQTPLTLILTSTQIMFELRARIQARVRARAYLRTF